MTPKAQRIAIAEACGWTWESRKHPAPCWHKGDFFTGAALFAESRCREDYCDDLPDYLNDLNAMHEAEKMLTEEQRELFRSILVDVVRGTVDRLRITWQAALCHATAAQRAEAFLRTLGLWKD